MIPSNRLTLPSFAMLLSWFALTSCTTHTGDSESLAPGMVFLSNAEEETYSEILQAKQRVVLQIELVDTVRPQHLTIDGMRGYVVPHGNRRVQFRALLPSTGWNDSRMREARGYVDVELVAGHRYRFAGQYQGNLRIFFLLDLTTNNPASPAIDLGFFGPVRRELEFIPIIIPIK